MKWSLIFVLVAIVGLVAAEPVPKVGGGGECALCEFVVSEIDKYVEETTTETEIIHLVERVCSWLPKTLQSECDSLIEEYGPQLITLFIEKEFQPDQICALIGLCAKEDAPDGVECALCEWIMTEVEKLITTNRSEEYIKELIEKACDILPKSVQDECQQLIDKYADEIIQLLIAKEDPKTICTQIGVCTSLADDGVECALCEWILGKIEDYITANSSEAEITKVVETICTYLPKTVQDECKSLIEKYGAEIINLLVNEESPEQICTAIGLCASFGDDGVECALCEWILGKIEDYITANSSEAEITKVVETICTYLPKTVQDECKSLIEKYGAEIINLLVNEESPEQICTAIGLCASMSHEDSIECAVCEWILSELEKLVEDNSTEAEILAALEKVCNFLPASIAKTCDDFIENYGKLILDLLVNHVDPKAVCTEIGVCAKTNGADSVYCALCEWVLAELEQWITENSTETEIVALVEKACNFLPESMRQVCDDFIEEYGYQIINLLISKEDPKTVCTLLTLCSQEHAQNGAECAICEWVMGEIDKYLSEASTEAEITALVEKVCNYLPASMKGSCDALIEQYGPAIISLLVQEMDPDTICGLIGLCSSMDDSNDMLCAACEWIMSVIEHYITENSTEVEIEKLLENICGILPESLKGPCDQLIEEYLPALVEQLVQEQPPELVCAEVGACKREDEPTGALECAACEWLMSVVEQYLSDNSSEAEIKAILEKACTYLPGALVQECEQIVDEYLDQIIQLIVQKYKPDQICKMIGLCASSTDGALECAACEWLLSVVEQYLSDNSTEAEIKAILEKACTYLPGALVQECEQIVDEYLDQIIDLIVQQYPADQICKMIGLCGSSADGGLECAACEWLLSTVEKYISENSTEEEIRAILEKGCSFLPKELAQECVTLVDEYEDAIIALLVNKFPADVVCKEIGLCGSSQIALLMRVY